MFGVYFPRRQAAVAELVDATDSKSVSLTRSESSILSRGTKEKEPAKVGSFSCLFLIGESRGVSSFAPENFEAITQEEHIGFEKVSRERLAEVDILSTPLKEGPFSWLENKKPFFKEM